MIQSVLAWCSPPRDGWRVTYDDWVPSLDTTRELTTDDLPAIRASGAAFCRKVDPVTSAELLRSLDARLAAPSGAQLSAPSGAASPQRRG